MTAKSIGEIAGLIVFLSAIPYAIRVYQGKIKINPITWFIWSIIGLALLLTYKSSGGKGSIWPAVFGFINPTIVTVIAFSKHWKEIKRPNQLEWTCLFIGLVSLGFWVALREDANSSKYALFLALLADSMAFLPTIIFLIKYPKDDRPLMWLTYAFGYGISMIAIKEHTIANYALPVYMTLGATIISIPLVVYRIRERIPLKEWI